MPVDLKFLVIEAGCPEAKADRCAKLIERAVIECLRAYRSRGEPRAKPKVLQRIAALRKALVRLDGDRHGEMAQWAVSYAMPKWDQAFIDHSLRGLERAERAVEGAMKRRRGAPVGSQDRTGYDWLVMRLWGVAPMCGFKWTAYKARTRSAKPAGSLLAMIRAIEHGWPLPKEFVPASNITVLKSIERAKAQLRP